MLLVNTLYMSMSPRVRDSNMSILGIDIVWMCHDGDMLTGGLSGSAAGSAKYSSVLFCMDCSTLRKRVSSSGGALWTSSLHDNGQRSVTVVDREMYCFKM